MLQTMKKSTYLLLFISILLTCRVAQAQEQPPEKSPEDAAIDFIKKGDMMVKVRQFDKAILEYDYALAISDTLSRAHFSKGMAYFSMKDADKAIPCLEKSIALNPGLEPAYGALIKCYTIKEDMESTLNTMDRMADMASDPAQKLASKLKIAQYYQNTKEFQKALKYTTQAIAIDRTSLDAQYYHAAVNNGLGNYDEARKVMESATSTLTTTDPKVTVRLFYELGFAYHKLKMFDKSKEALEKADYGPYKPMVAKLNPEYYQSIAMSYTMVYDYKNALAMLQEALAIDPSMASANKLMAEISLKTDNFSQKAVDYYQRAISGESDPKQAVGLYEQIVELMLNAGKFNEAVTFSDKCLSQVSNARNILFMKAIALHQSGKAPQALAIIEQLLKDANLTPLETVKYQLIAGKLYCEMKDFEKAVEAYKQSGKGPFAFISMHEIEKAETIKGAVKAG